MRKNLFDNDFRSTSAVYEVGVMLPGYTRRKIYPVFYRTSQWGFSVYKGVEPISILRQKTVRQQTNRVLNDECKIFMRRGVLKKSKDWEDTEQKMNKVKQYLRRFDYVWRKLDRHNHRKLVRDKIVLSDSTLSDSTL